LNEPDKVVEDFTSDLDPRWQRYVRGGGSLRLLDGMLRFVNQDTTRDQYTNAQIDDYQGLRRGDFLWRPPLTLTVRARFSHSRTALVGTAGFGFWNDPFMMTGWRFPALPRAIWFFFASEESNMKLDLDVPGYGWKAAMIDAMRWPFLALLPTIPLGIALMNLRPLYRRLWPVAQRAIGVQEALIHSDMRDWHTYKLVWGNAHSRFWVDDEQILACGAAPGGPLGFVMWLDNQYAIVTPWGRFGHGLLKNAGEQWLEVEHVVIEKGIS
jgi:hypothetical protein